MTHLVQFPKSDARLAQRALIERMGALVDDMPGGANLAPADRGVGEMIDDLVRMTRILAMLDAPENPRAGRRLHQDDTTFLVSVLTAYGDDAAAYAAEVERGEWTGTPDEEGAAFWSAEEMGARSLTERLAAK